MSQETKTSGPKFTSIEPESTYRPISQLAIISLLLGLASITAFANVWTFGFIAPIALLFSWWVSRKLEAAKREYAGQVLAKLAMFIAFVSGIGSVTRYATQQYILTREARAYADNYLDQVLTHHAKAAFVLKTPPWKRPKELTERDIDNIIKQGTQNYRVFLGDGVFLMLAGKLKDAQVTYAGPLASVYGEGLHQFVLEYIITLNEAGEEHRHRFSVLVKGNASPDNQWEGRQWYVDDMKLLE